MTKDGPFQGLDWWEISVGANIAISIIYGTIFLLIVAPAARNGQLRTNKLASATAIIFVTCAVGRALYALYPLLPELTGDPNPAPHVNIWWISSWNVVVALAGTYYLTLRSHYWGLFSAEPLFDDLIKRERIEALEALAAETAGRAEAEAERDANAEMLREIIQNAPAAIYVKDLEGRYLMAGPGLQEIMGRSETEIIGRTDAIVDADLAPLWRVNDIQAESGSYRLCEWNDAFPDGRHYYESVKFPLHDAHGGVYGTCGISLDVTETRSAILATAEARDVAVAATAAKSTFLATMSHEIRTPMNAVIGMTDLLLDTDLDDQQHEFASTARSSGHALLSVINDILDFSKIESGELRLEAEPFDLLSTVESCMDFVASAANTKGLDLVCYTEQDCPARVVGDSARLRQVVVNLLSNAVKFTTHGEVLVHVDSTPVDEGRVKISIGVTDTGIGISREGVDRLFRSFSQVDPSTTRLYGGTGLGLVITKRLAEAMGGSVEVTSRPGTGSTFTATVVLGNGPDAAKVGDIDPLERSVLSGRSVLLVDDNATNLRVLDLQLTTLGMVCTAVAEPCEAIALVENGLTFDLAVIDMSMPSMSGIDLGRALHQSAAGGAPLVLLTCVGWRPGDDDDGFSAFISKPVRSTVLRDALITVLTGTKPEAARAPSRVATAPEPIRPLRILLAEDNLVNQRVARLMLDKLGQRVDVVSDGREAVEAVSRSSYDVVLMDIQMPVMDGLEATRGIRERLPQSKQPQIVAMTASVLVEDRVACTAAGMDGYLTKPVRVQDLRLLLASLQVHGDQAHHERAAAPPDGPDEPTLAQPGAGRGPAVDASVLAELKEQLDDDSGEAIAGLIDSYLSEAAGQVASLLVATLGADPETVAALAHTLRSSSRLLGASDLADLLQQTEDVARSVPADLTSLAAPIQAEFARVSEELTIMQSAANPPSDPPGSDDSSD